MIAGRADSLFFQAVRAFFCLFVSGILFRINITAVSIKVSAGIYSPFEYYTLPRLFISGKNKRKTEVYVAQKHDREPKNKKSSFLKKCKNMEFLSIKSAFLSRKTEFFVF